MSPHRKLQCAASVSGWHSDAALERLLNEPLTKPLGSMTFRGAGEPAWRQGSGLATAPSYRAPEHTDQALPAQCSVRARLQQLPHSSVNEPTERARLQQLPHSSVDEPTARALPSSIKRRAVPPLPAAARGAATRKPALYHPRSTLPPDAPDPWSRLPQTSPNAQLWSHRWLKRVRAAHAKARIERAFRARTQPTRTKALSYAGVLALSAFSMLTAYVCTRGLLSAAELSLEPPNPTQLCSDARKQ